jgi:CheY-like chemotaxis protein
VVEQAGIVTLLVIDDRGEVAHVAQAMLEAIGYVTVAAKNAGEAIEIMRGEKSVDLLFTDLIMPDGINGVMLARSPAHSSRHQDPAYHWLCRFLAGAHRCRRQRVRYHSQTLPTERIAASRADRAGWTHRHWLNLVTAGRGVRWDGLLQKLSLD